METIARGVSDAMKLPLKLLKNTEVGSDETQEMCELE